MHCSLPCAERMWNMSIPGFGVEEQPHRKSASSEAHKQVFLYFREPCAWPRPGKVILVALDFLSAAHQLDKEIKKIVC